MTKAGMPAPLLTMLCSWASDRSFPSLRFFIGKKESDIYLVGLLKGLDEMTYFVVVLFAEHDSSRNGAFHLDALKKYLLIEFYLSSSHIP